MVWGVQSWNGGLPVGQLIAFINYITQLLMSMLMLSNMLTFFSRAKVSADRENEVFSTISEITEVANAKKDAIHNGRIVFDNVSFAYDPTDENLVLDGINFTAEPGETVPFLVPPVLVNHHWSASFPGFTKCPLDRSQLMAPTLV